jgi:hypothetical protein
MLHMLLHKVVITKMLSMYMTTKIIKPLPKFFVHECAKCGSECKRHHQELVEAMLYVPSGLLFVPFNNSNVVIS